MSKRIGMPATRPFTTDPALGRVFVIDQASLADLEKAKGIDLLEPAQFAGDPVFGFSGDEAEEFLKKSGLVALERRTTGEANVDRLLVGVKPNLPLVIDWKLGARSRVPEHPFSFVSWDGQNKRAVGYLASRMLMSVVGRAVELLVPHKADAEYRADGAFRIHIWSTPDARLCRMQKPPQKIWGIPVDCRDDAFQPSGVPEGIAISDGPYVVAELRKNALYIHHDIVQTGSGNEFALLYRILEEAREYLADPLRYDAALASSRDAYQAHQQATYRELVRRAIPVRAERDKVVLDAAREDAARKRAAYFAAERHLFGLEQSSGKPEDIARRFTDELAKIQRGGVRQVVGLFFEDVGKALPLLHVETEELRVRNPRTGILHVIGRFDITFDLENGGVRFKNRDRLCAGMHAPHVNGDGAPCLGTIKRELPAYLAHFEIEAAITLALAFLQAVDPDDSWGAKVAYFPVAQAPAEETAHAAA